ncbi:CMGC/DYRK/PRP4 protein kinase [Mycena kentingensis (nom. inval.)]|nr:CMGC/DYRK/PRP4 protein kinase [Mycena kentingensis (nom. inval.)]
MLEICHSDFGYASNAAKNIFVNESDGAQHLRLGSWVRVWQGGEYPRERNQDSDQALWSWARVGRDGERDSRSRRTSVVGSTARRRSFSASHTTLLVGYADEIGGLESVEQKRASKNDVIRKVFIQKTTRDLLARRIGAGAGRTSHEETHFVDLLDRCLALDHARRINPREALGRPFIRGPTK